MPFTLSVVRKALRSIRTEHPELYTLNGKQMEELCCIICNDETVPVFEATPYHYIKDRLKIMGYLNTEAIKSKYVPILFLIQ